MGGVRGDRCREEKFGEVMSTVCLVICLRVTWRGEEVNGCVCSEVFITQFTVHIDQVETALQI